MKLGFEKLEERVLMAVRVTQAANGSLAITGDGFDNLVEVFGTGTADEVDVWVDGAFIDTFSDVTNIRANLGAGDDILHVEDVDIQGSLITNLGQGEDLFALIAVAGPVTIGTDVHITLGAQEFDQVIIDGLGDSIDIGRNLHIAGAADIDILGSGFDQYDNTEVGDVNIGGNLVVNAINAAVDLSGDGFTTNLSSVHVGGNASFLRKGNSADLVNIEFGSVGGDLTGQFGGGDDEINSSFNEFQGRATVQAGAGNDSFSSNDTEFFGAVLVNGSVGTNDLFDNGGNFGNGFDNARFQGF